MRMSAAAWGQGVVVVKERVREFLLNSETGRRAVALEGRGQGNRTERNEEESVKLETLSGDGKRVASVSKKVSGTPGSGYWSDEED